MTIDEAIKTNQEILRSDRLLHWPEAQDTVTFDIEALKQIKEARKWNLIISEPRLPGETEEKEKQPLGRKQKPS
ncbi:hypothetical protein ES705_45109 [subsurface metagenome]